MGNCIQKQPPSEGDVKFIHSKDLAGRKVIILKDIFRFLLVPIWYRDYNRKTNLGKGKNPVKLKKKIKNWLAEAHKRKAGNDKKRKVYIAVAREEDNDTGVVRGRGRQPQPQPAVATATLPESSAPVGQIT
ncbi:hypothetical protein GOODEAATRI_034642 [Goodea atripinnis]|uniref:Uncharacterized protein n=1 Tax=Goodea atripinnis TaxID=208336 RepID=A0ABV0MPB4_9TELE